MYLGTLGCLMVPVGLLADDDKGESRAAVNDLRNLLRDEAAIGKMKEPLYGNGRLRFDPAMQHTLCELAWFYDSSRIEEMPSWDRHALEKMRKPLLGFSHYRVTPTTMPILFNLAWFHDGLVDGNSEQ